MARARQTAFVFRTWGGKRKGAGRKRKDGGTQKVELLCRIDTLDELDRLAEQSFFVSPRARRRAEHQRGGEQVSPDP